MENPILDFMHTYWSDYEVNYYKEILDTIASAHEDWPDNLDLYFNSLSGNEDIEDISTDIRNMVLGMLKEMFGEIGVILNEDYPLNNIYLFDIYKELIEIENTEQIEFALSVLESEDNTETLFYELLTTVGGLTIDESLFMSHIAKISIYTKQKLINKLEVNKALLPVEVPEVDIMGMVEKIKTFTRKINDDEFLVIRLIKEGVNLGLEFQNYMALYGSEILELDLKEMTYNLYLLGLISKDATDSVAETIESNIANYLFDYSDQDKVIRAIREIQIKLGNME